MFNDVLMNGELSFNFFLYQIGAAFMMFFCFICYDNFL